MELQIGKLLSFSKFKHPGLPDDGTDTSQMQLQTTDPDEIGAKIRTTWCGSEISAWEKSHYTLIRNFVESMPRRIAQCNRKRADHIGTNRSKIFVRKVVFT